jgi:hypothetical protein
MLIVFWECNKSKQNSHILLIFYIKQFYLKSFEPLENQIKSFLLKKITFRLFKNYGSIGFVGFSEEESASSF